MKIKTVGVIGAGVMGTDVALDLGCYDYKIILKDISPEILVKARKKIKNGVRLIKMMKPGMKDLKTETVLSRINFVAGYEGFEEVDLVVENVTENWVVKQQVYRELAGICRPETRYAINTSCISITKIAALLPEPGNAIGVHFMNPVPLKKMVETVVGYHTSDKTKDMVLDFLKSINKNPVVVCDYPGFVANRLSHLFMNEAAYLVQDGVAEAPNVDSIFKEGYGHKMGPLETADLIGLDTVLNSLDVLYQEYQDPKFRCCPLLKKMVHAGLLGKKSGQGFYSYQ